ncbi:3-oxoacyl-[acyl-carrier-protein] synthase, KASIII [hydrothermal vent metagenome]|uniref:3-oxoacyl-[acyl-carrier-protein] synthase, KASIII n=1 Tax=hydrothermal vent metagenome TaxID=652676 RepID=A0A3B1B354_9ZZZZ
MQTAKIIGTGSFLPGEAIPFDNIQEHLGDVPDAPKRVKQWIKDMTPVMKDMLAMQNYYYALNSQTREFTEDNISMSVKAARKALDAAGVKASDIDLICYGSAQQNQMPPATVRIQEALGIKLCAEMAIYSNCTSAYKSLLIATEMVKSGQSKNALVISSNLVSSGMVPEYYNQKKLTRETVFMRWFLCDGAAAMVVNTDDTKQGLVVEGNFLESIGCDRESIMHDGRLARPVSPLEEFDSAAHHVMQSFRNTLNSGVFQDETGKSVMFSGMKRMLEKLKLNIDGLKYLQINLPSKQIVEILIDEVVELGITKSALYTKLDEIGYCGPPMAFMCIDQIMRNENLKNKDKILSFVTEVSKFMQAGFLLRAEGYSN